MADPINNSDESRLDAILVGVVERLEASEPVDFGKIDPEFVEDVTAFVKDWALMDQHSSKVDRVKRPPPRLEFSAKMPFSLGQFEVEEEIGRGGMGIVYRVKQSKPARQVALKILRWGPLATEKEKDRFWAEIESVAKLQHPNIVPLLEAEEIGGIPYLLMPLVEGVSLEKLPRQSVREEVKRIAVVARAIAFANAAEMIHRDIKPSNILIEAAGGVFVTDFGLAKQLSNDLGLSSTGAFPGTPRYMAPEILLGRQRQTIQIDVYSLGVVLYERLTGKFPFEGETVAELLNAVQHRLPIEPRRQNSEVDRDLSTLTLKCLEKLPENRLGSAAELAAELDLWLEGKPIRTRPATPIEQVWKWGGRHYRPLGIVVTTAVLVSLLWSLTFFKSAPNGEERARSTGTDLNRSNDAISRLSDEMSADRHVLAVERLKWSQEAWSQGRTMAATELLTQVPTEEIDWDWRYLAQLYQGGDQVLDGHTETITSVIFSPTGHMLFSSGKDRLRAWNWRTGTPMPLNFGNSRENMMPDQSDLGVCLVLSHDGNRLFRDSSDGSIAIWEARQLRLVGRISGAPEHGRIKSLAASSNGKWLAACYQDGCITLWDIDSQSRTADVQRESYCDHIRFSPDSSLLISGDVRSQLTAFSLPDLAPQWEHAVTGGVTHNPILGLEFLDQGKTVVGLAENGCVDFRDVQTGALSRPPIRKRDAGIEGATAICPAITGDRIFIACALGPARIAAIQERSVDDWSLLSTRQGFLGAVESLAVSPDGTTLAAAGFDKSIRLWRLDDESKNSFAVVHPQIALLADGKRIVASDGSRLITYSLSKKQVVTVIDECTSGWFVTPPVVVAENKVLIGTSEGYIQEFDMALGCELRTSRFSNSAIVALAVSRDGGHLVCVDQYGVVRFSTTQSLASRSELRLPPSPNWRLACDEKHTLIWRGTDWLFQWFPDKGDVAEQLVFNECKEATAHNVGCIEMGQGSQFLWAVNSSVYLCESSTRRVISEFRGHDSQVTDVKWLPGEKRFVSGSIDGSICVSSPAVGETLRLHSSVSPIVALGVSKEGLTLVAADADHFAHIWSVPQAPPHQSVGHSRVLVDEMALSPSGNFFATLDQEKTVRIFESSFGTLRSDFQLKSPPSGAMTISDSGRVGFQTSPRDSSDGLFYEHRALVDPKGRFQLIPLRHAVTIARNKSEKLLSAQEKP